MFEEKIRKFENWHILLWLLKDLCWVMGFKAFGTFMIIPTVSLALVITVKTRKIFSELMHNIAVVCWICANSAWMFGEFFYLEESPEYERQVLCARLFFVTGIASLLVYYTWFFVKKAKR